MSELQGPRSGWYVDPLDSSRLRWWDGANWLDHYAPAPAAPVATLADTVPLEPMTEDAGHATIAALFAEPANESAPTLGDRAASFVQSPRVEGAAISTAGAALAAGGVVSMAKDKRTPLILLCGLIASALGVLMLVTGASFPGMPADEATTTGVVTKVQDKSWLSGDCIPTIEYEVNGDVFTTRPEEFAECVWAVGDTAPVAYEIENAGIVARLGVAEQGVDGISFMPAASVLTVVGMVVSAWAFIAIAVRAGSIAGGAALFIHGFGRSKQK